MTLLARFLILVAVALLPSVAMHVHDLATLHRAELARARDDAERLTIAIDGAMARIVEAGREVLLVLAEDDDIRFQRRIECREMLARLKEVLPPAEDIMVTDEKRTVICSTDPAANGIFIGDQPHVAAAASEAFAIGQFFKRKVSRRPSLGIAVPYRHGPGSQGGILAMAISLAWLEDELGKHAAPPRSVVTLTDRQGIVLARLPKKDSLIGTRSPDPIPVGAGIGIRETDGMVLGTSPLSLGDADLMISVAVPKDHLGQQVMGRLIRGVGVGVATLAAALAAAVFLYRRLLVPPVRALQAAGAVWAHGDYGARASIPATVPELAELARAFNAMAAAILDREDARETARAAERRMAEMHRQTERALARINAQLEALIVNAPIGFCFVDRSHRYVRLNDRLAAINGVPAARHLGRRIAEILPEIAAVVDPTIDIVFASGKAVEGIVVSGRTAAQPGVTRHWLCGFFPVTDADGIALVGTVVMEITEQKRIEEALRRADMAKSRFLASASHDLRQPVQSMMLFTSALAHTLKDHPAAAIVTHIDRATMVLKTMLDGILDISRLDAGIVAPDVRDADLGPLFEHLAEDYRSLAETKGVRMTVVSTSRRVRTDPVLLERMLGQLMENALKYTGEGGKTVVGCRRHGTMVRIVVADSGIGVPETEREAIFDEFYQVANPERDRSKGLGLGLAIVQRLGRLLGHDIGLASMPGKGTRFWIDVPAAS